MVAKGALTGDWRDWAAIRAWAASIAAAVAASDETTKGESATGEPAAGQVADRPPTQAR